MSERTGEARGGVDAVVVAAGASQRMGGIDKLTAVVGGRPLLAWSVAAMAVSNRVERVVVVVAPERVVAIARAGWLPAGSEVVAGGATRQASVAAGVRHLARTDPAGSDRAVLVHDGARPLASAALVEAVIDAVITHGAAIPVQPIAETLKRVDGDRVVETVERAGLAAAQTPQGVRRRLLLEAWDRFPPDRPPAFTDEAALLEACTISVHAIPGEPANLKVTLPDDLSRVERELAAPGMPRVGFGHDSHPFGPGSPLRLGGVSIPGAPALAGHSDGDVVLHAVADALLGAAGMGDLGRLFPSDERTPRAVDSSLLLRDVVARLAAAGMRPASIDVTVIGARPRFGDRLDAMRGAIATTVGLDVARVNVKGSTGNLAGDEGAGRSISARVVATVGGPS
jgi:2-C-methyl-D-erythritol 4-phosphate cytidylyltransferase / 2-C-methyl-D-erythritol 2,4-cyclodiphosphate synthase